jgi:hypothetical protein
MPLLQAMPFIMTHGGNMDLSDVTTQELLDECHSRGLMLKWEDEPTLGDTNELIDLIYRARREGRPYDHLLDEYLYQKTGRAV